MAATNLTATLECAPIGAVHVLSARVHEAISEPTSGYVRFTSDAPVDLDGPIGQTAHLAVVGNDVTRHFHLLVARVTYEGLRSQRYVYGVDLVHELHRARLRTDVRTFQQMTAKDIIAKVLLGAGVAADHTDWKVARTLLQRVYCVQYRETDFAFVSRLLEHEGIFYLTSDDDSATKITFADGPDAFTAIDGDSSLAVNDESARGHGVFDFEVEYSSVPDASTLKDWNYETPRIDLKVRTETGAASPQGETFEFPGGFPTMAEGNALVKLRAEELVSRKTVGRGSSDHITLQPGRWFELTGTSRESLATKYVVRSVTHEVVVNVFEQDGEGAGRDYVNTFTCSPQAMPYRPPRVTPPARVHGSHNVVVMGPSGEEIHTEPLGRMKAKFFWDRVGKDDDSASCWIRVTQLPIGSSMTLARTKWEMIVRYVHGDPDRPVAVARTDNGSHTAPYAYPAAKTAMSMKTLSSPGGGKFSEISMEDGGGGMKWAMTAAKDYVEQTNNNKSETIAVDEKLTVGSDANLIIGSNQKTSIAASQTTSISSDHGIKIGGNRTKSVSASETCTISGNETNKITGSDTETTGGSWIGMAALGLTKTMQGSHSETVAGSKLQLAAMGLSTSVIGAYSETVGAVKICVTGGKATESSIGALAVTVGGVVVHAAAGNRIASSSGSGAVTVGGAAIANAGEKFAIKAKTIKIIVGGVANFTGGGGIITLTPASASVVPLVTFKGSGGVKLTGSPNVTG
jgi:type VI secretion system secreted protein VgrG